jgi:isopentenyl-diphosphate Delta-isomerase
MARSTIVDKSDEVIGYKDSKEVQPTDIYRVAALWITNSKGEILLAQRAFSKRNDPGLWGPAVAGTVEEGETYDSNIIKEAEEELGLKDIAPTKGPKFFRVTNRTYFCQWYHLVLDKPLEFFRIEPKEVEAIRWVSKENLLEELKQKPENFLPSAQYWEELLKYA